MYIIDKGCQWNRISCCYIKLFILQIEWCWLHPFKAKILCGVGELRNLVSNINTKASKKHHIECLNSTFLMQISCRFNEDFSLGKVSKIFNELLLFKLQVLWMFVGIIFEDTLYTKLYTHKMKSISVTVLPSLYYTSDRKLIYTSQLKCALNLHIICIKKRADRAFGTN